MPATINTPQYLLDQAKRRLKPTPVTLPGMGAVEKRLRDRDWDQFVLAEPPAGSDLKPVMGDAGLPVIGHLIEVFRGGPDFVLDLYRKHGPVYYSHNVALSQVMALGPDATQAVFSNRNKEFSQRAWDPVIGPFFEGGLMLLDGEEHMFHRRIMQDAFTRSRLTGYVPHVDSVASAVLVTSNGAIAASRAGSGAAKGTRSSCSSKAPCPIRLGRRSISTGSFAIPMAITRAMPA